MLGINRVVAISGTAVALIAVVWSLIFPAVVDVEQQELGGPLRVRFGPGAYLVAVGVVAVSLGAGLAFLPHRGRRTVTLVVTLVVGGALAAALR